MWTRLNLRVDGARGTSTRLCSAAEGRSPVDVDDATVTFAGRRSPARPGQTDRRSDRRGNCRSVYTATQTHRPCSLFASPARGPFRMSNMEATEFCLHVVLHGPFGISEMAAIFYPDRGHRILQFTCCSRASWSSQYSKTPFTPYNRLSNRLFNRFHNRLNVCLLLFNRG